VALGGLRSSDGAIHTRASDINNLGQVVGGTGIPGLDRDHDQAFLLNPRDTDEDGKPDLWFVDEEDNATGSPGADGQNDLILGLGNLPGALHAPASAVNDLGVVVGLSYYWDPATQISRTEAYIVAPNESGCWYQDSDNDGVNDLMLPLGKLPGMPDPAAPNGLNINNRGQVIGCFYSEVASGVYQLAGFLLTPEVVAPGVWQWFQDDGNGANALMVSLGSFVPGSINDNGQIAGGMDGRAMLWNPGGSLIDLRLGGTQSQAIAINNRGQIGVWWKADGVGHAGLLTPVDGDGDGEPDAWYRDSNGDGVNDLVTDLGALKRLENSYLYAHGLNDNGSVAGGCWHADPRSGLGYERAGFLWENGVIQSLQSLTDGTLEFPNAGAINNARQIVAEGSGRHFDYENGSACILLPTR